MVFTEEQYKFINVVAPHLSAYAEFMELLGRDVKKGEIELLFRRMGHQQKFQFEAVIAHARTFMPEWEKVVFKTTILAYNSITSAKYDFKSNFFPGPVSLERLRQYCSLADGHSGFLGLERNVLVGSGITPETYRLQGWIQGPVRNALLGHDYLRDNLGKGIEITGTLSYM